MKAFHLSEREGFWELIEKDSREVLAVFRCKQSAITSSLKYVAGCGGRLSLARHLMAPRSSGDHITVVDGRIYG